ncbi:MAG: 3-dehydroquinate synthase family protein [Elusimicrobiota bacterium]
MKYKISRTEKTEIKVVDSLESIKSMNLKSDKVCLITDNFCLEKFSREISVIKKISGTSFFYVYVIGEKEPKTIKNYEKAVAFLVNKKFSRQSRIFALGGGGVSDFAGFIASTFMRGIRCVFFPTTFLSQIDAASGGKNALNISGFKNIIGVFSQPELIICNISFLKTRAGIIKNGAGELIKYMFLDRKKFPKDIKKFYGKIKSLDLQTLKKAVRTCLDIKTHTVIRDPLDKTGIREVLNLGHTAGHAFESASDNRISHGEAVLWGLRYAYLLSVEILHVKERFKREAQTLLNLENPDKKINDIKFADFYRGVSIDKKRKGINNRFILLKNFGKTQPVENLNKKTLELVLRRLKHEYSDN